MIAKYKHPNSSSTRAAKLSLLNFFSLFRDLHKSTRYSAGGGVAAELFRVLHKPTRFSGGGGVVAAFFSYLRLRNHIFTPTSSDVHG